MAAARRSDDPQSLERRVAQALTRAHRQGVDVSTHRAAIERRLDSITQRIAARDHPPATRAQ